jgi:hypothetical protein
MCPSSVHHCCCCCSCSCSCTDNGCRFGGLRHITTIIDWMTRARVLVDVVYNDRNNVVVDRRTTIPVHFVHKANTTTTTTTTSFSDHCVKKNMFHTSLRSTRRQPKKRPRTYHGHSPNAGYKTRL